MSIEKIVDEMIAYGRTLKGIGRAWIDASKIKSYQRKDIGPFWAVHDTNMPPREVIEKGGIVCTGLINLMTRKVGIHKPFLDLQDQEDNDIIFGLGGSDEWLYYYRDHVEPFDENAIYPKGTLLLRTWNPVDDGHIAMLIETGKRVVDCHLLHTIGGAFQKHGEVVTDEDLVSDSHYGYKKGFKPRWGPEFGVSFGNNGYYTHILRPEKYIPNAKSVYNINGKSSSFKF